MKTDDSDDLVFYDIDGGEWRLIISDVNPNDWKLIKVEPKEFLKPGRYEVT